MWVKSDCATRPGSWTLGEDDLVLRAVLGPPARDVVLEGAQLAFLVVTRPPAREQGEEDRALQGRVALELGANPRPVLLEGIGPGAIGARGLELAGELAHSLILAGRPDAHPGPGRGLFLGLAFGALALHQSYLRIAFHGVSYSDAMSCRLRGDLLKRQV